MYKLALFFFQFVIGSSPLLAQRKVSSDTIRLPEKISKFIPNGYLVIDTATGNLNLDKHKDVILLLKRVGEDTADYTWDYKRTLIILLGTTENLYTVAARNDNILDTYDRSSPFGDPYQGIRIANGTFTVSQIGGGALLASTEEITFKFDVKQNTWYLHKVFEESWTRQRTRKGVEKADVEKKTYTKRNFGMISITKYENWR